MLPSDGGEDSNSVNTGSLIKIKLDDNVYTADITNMHVGVYIHLNMKLPETLSAINAL